MSLARTCARTLGVALLIGVLIGCDRSAAQGPPAADTPAAPAQATTQPAPEGATAQMDRVDVACTIEPQRHWLTAQAQVTWEALKPASAVEFDQIGAIYDSFSPGGAERPAESITGPRTRIDNTGGGAASGQALIGTWVSQRQGYSFSFTFAVGGAYTSSQQAPSGQPTQGRGSYALAGDILELRPQGLSATRKYKCQMLNARTLQLVDEIGRTMVFSKQQGGDASGQR